MSRGLNAILIIAIFLAVAWIARSQPGATPAQVNGIVIDQATHAREIQQARDDQHSKDLAENAVASASRESYCRRSR